MAISEAERQARSGRMRDMHAAKKTANTTGYTTEFGVTDDNRTLPGETNAFVLS